MRRGQIIPKDTDIPHKRFLLRVYVGRENGKRKYASKAVEGTYKQAEAKLTEMLRELDIGSFVGQVKLSVYEYLIHWLGTRRDIEPTTRADYERRLRLDVYPSLGSMQLQHLTPARVRTLYTALAERVGARTIWYTHSILTQAFDRAVLDGLLRKNPCANTTEAIGRRPKSTGGTALTPDEARKILATPNRRYGVLFHLLLATGMRPGEALALRWQDCSGDALAVRRSLTTDGDGHSYIKEYPKNTGSVRSVEIDGELVEQLQGHRKGQLEVVLKAGDQYDRAGDLVFANPVGRYMIERDVRRAWYTHLAKAGVRKVRLYDTRHTHLSWLLQAGENPKVVAGRSGHTNPVVLLNTYAHVLPGAAREAAGLFSRVLRGTNADGVSLSDAGAPRDHPGTGVHRGGRTVVGALVGSESKRTVAV